MYVEFDLNIRECNVVNGACECCGSKNDLRLVEVDINCHYFQKIILCTKCLISTNKVRLRK